MQAGLPEGWGVKDSFCALDLAPLGFHALFEAQWIYRDATQPKPSLANVDLTWARIRDAAGLAAWEETWEGDPPEIALSRPPRAFLPALLDDADIAFLAGYRGNEIVAGCIANRTGEVSGLSNVFGPAEDAANTWAGSIASTMDAFPGLPLVGYERDESLRQACALGFATIGHLRVWLQG